MRRQLGSLFVMVAFSLTVVSSFAGCAQPASGPGSAGDGPAVVRTLAKTVEVDGRQGVAA